VRRFDAVGRPALAAYPGLLSVLAGRVGLVGIAPLSAREILELPPVLRDIHAEARPGLVGSWALRMNLGVESCRWLDLEYVRGWTLIRDWKTLVRSFGRVAAVTAGRTSAPEAP
jgi:lipopolysaccharide/colanic/teichoic acid biosynthesis glycosyltransferase